MGALAVMEGCRFNYPFLHLYSPIRRMRDRPERNNFTAHSGSYEKIMPNQ
jgi:hypothetical protein